MNRVLVIQAESRTMNPLLDQEMIDAEYDEDREAARSEWGGEFREDIGLFLNDELIDAAIIAGRLELPFVSGCHFFAFADSSGGRFDAFTLSIAHRDGERVVQDRLLIENPPFVPDEIVESYCAILKSYGLASVVGDRYAGEWVSAAFAKHGIDYQSSGLDTSALYLEVLPQFTARSVDLLDVPRLATELRLLERRPRSARGDLVTHPPRAHDDAANASCGSLWLAAAELVDDASQVLPSAWIRAAQERWQPEPPYGIPQCAIGVGVRGHLDPVIALRHDGWFAPLIVVASNETPHGRDLAALVIKHRQHEALPVLDVGEGLGGQAFAHLKANGIKGFALRAHDEVFEKTAEKQMGFADRRSAAYWRFREALDPGQVQGSPIALPDDPELVVQLSAVTWELTPRGIKVESKEKLEAKLRRASNRADAVVAAWYRGPRAMTHIQEWRPDERVGPMVGLRRQPKVNMGPRRASLRRWHKSYL